MNDARFILDKRAIRHAFARSAEAYDDVAVLQREICDRTLTHLDPIKLLPVRVLDLGAGTGYAIPFLRRRYRKAGVVAVDLSHAMIRNAHRQQARRFRNDHFVCADADALPFPDGSFDLVFSNLMLQWCSDLDRTLAECRRLLRSGGLLLFSTFGPDTLKELRACWQKVDTAAHVHVFLDMHDIGDAMIRNGFGGPVLDVETLTVQYGKVERLLRDLKSLGATNAAQGRRRGLLRRTALVEMIEAYDAYQHADGTFPATYEVVYGHCWSPQAGARPQDGSTVATFPVDKLGHL